MVRWWKDPDGTLSDKPGSNSPPRHDYNRSEDQQLPAEDIGEVTDDNSDEFDDVEPPDRGPDS